MENLIEVLNHKIDLERIEPNFSRHNLNSYRTNLPVDPGNKELKQILKYFDGPDLYLPLYQEEEFKEGLSIELKIEMLSKEEIEQNIQYRESLYHNHDFFELIYVYSGTCINLIDEEPVSLKEGSLMLFNLQTIHKIIVPDSGSVIMTFLIGREVFTDTLMSLMDQEDPLLRFYTNSFFNIPGRSFYVLDLNEIPRIQYLVLSMIETSMVRPRYYARTLLLDFEKLILLLSEELADRFADHESISQEIEAILWYMYAHYQTITLKDLANHFGYTERTLIRYLKKNTKKTFSEIIQDYRLLNVCADLKQTKLSLEDIAEKHGFRERSYMDKVFKKKYGTTPSAYRKRMVIKRG